MKKIVSMDPIIPAAMLINRSDLVLDDTKKSVNEIAIIKSAKRAQKTTDLGHFAISGGRYG